MKNNPVGHHEVDYRLSCGHINAEAIEAVLFVPKVGDIRTCLRCKQLVRIEVINPPYWVDEEKE